MKIKTITFTNFKRLANQEFVCNAGMNVFVGANNSGKTSILQAMAMVMRLEKYHISEPSVFQVKRLAYRLQGTGDWSIGLGIQLDRTEWEQMIAAESTVNTEFVRLYQNEQLFDELSAATVKHSITWGIQKGQTVNGRVRSPIEPLPAILKNPAEELNLNLIQALLLGIDFYAAYGHPIFLDAHSFVPFKEPFRSKNDLMNERTDVSTVRGRLFYLKQSEPEVFRELTAQLMAAFPEIKSVDVRLNTDEGVFEFILTEDIPVNGHSIEAQYDAADVGLGMQNLLILVANVLLLKPSVVLMDEPDVHMHPALVRDFVRIIKQLSQQTQFFITTHNIAFIDALAPEDIFTVVYRPEEKGSIIRSVAERNEVLDTLQNLGFNLSNSILSGKPKVYVFVEGNSDAMYLLHFAQRLGYAKSVAAFNVEFVPMNGKGERFKMLRLFERLGMIETPFFMVLDQDETSPEEMRTLRTTYFAKHPERLIYWSKRQIENYFLDIPTLQQLVHKELSKKASMDSSAKVDSFNVSSVLHRLAEEQSELIRERWLREMFVDESFLSREMLRKTYKAVSNMPLDEAVTEFNAELIKYFAKNSMRLSKVSESAIQQFQAKWNDPQTRLDMCDGRKLLTALQRELQEHFHCSFSNSEIISAMSQESIHTDIRTLLDALHILITTY